MALFNAEPHNGSITEASRPHNETKSDGSIFFGCALGCGSQILFLFLAFLAASAMRNDSMMLAVLCSWGITQWIGIIPLVINERKKNNRKTVQGLIITGALGLLLSSACAGKILL